MILRIGGCPGLWTSMRCCRSRRTVTGRIGRILVRFGRWAAGAVRMGMGMRGGEGLCGWVRLARRLNVGINTHTAYSMK